VTRRLTRIALPTLLAAAACFVARSAPASTLLKFRLANESTSAISKVDFKVIPPGAVVAPVVGTDPVTGKDLTGSPVTVLPGSTGVDTAHFSVALGSGPGVQGLRLLFGQTQTVGDDGKVTYTPALDSDGQPLGLFQPGAILNFALNVDSPDPSRVQLQLPDGAAGLSLKAFAAEGPVTKPDPEDPPVTPLPGEVDPPASQVPEPASMVLWSALAALALARVRTYRRSHPVAG
jgi:hypothetical protein